GNELSFYDQLTRVEDREVAAFLRRFSNVAQAEQDKFGIPPSITLASALLHARAGKTDAAVRYQSFFSLSCGEDWPGPTARAKGRCIRSYESAWTSFRDHSLYVTSGKFSPLLQFGETDYRRWAAGLEELGFNETENLAEQLLRTIDHYQLFQFD
ncbi:MAG: glucosaminidase domain-containing protein, partial [Bacteroidota bacterium]